MDTSTEIDNYHKRYINFLITISQIGVVRQIATLLLIEFPERLPADVKCIYDDAIQKINELGALPDTIYEFEDRSLAPFVMTYVFSKELYGKAEVDFYHIACVQQLIMIFAYLDAFLADSVRVICKTHPSILKSQKVATWEKIIDAGNWEQLIDELTDEYVREFGQPNAAKRIQFMSKHLALKLKVSEKDLEFLDEAENVRHAFVHNGGRIDTSFVKKIKKAKHNVGSLIEVDRYYIEHLSDIAVNLSTDIFVSIGEKYLQANLLNKPMSVWKTGKVH